MRDDRSGIHRECRRLFFFLIVYERGLQTGARSTHGKVVQSAEPVWLVRVSSCAWFWALGKGEAWLARRRIGCVCVMLVCELVFRRLSGCCTVRSCVVTGTLVVEAVSAFIDAEAAVGYAFLDAHETVQICTQLCHYWNLVVEAVSPLSTQKQPLVMPFLMLIFASNDVSRSSRFACLFDFLAFAFK